MLRFLPIPIALGEAAALHGCQPTAAQFTGIESALRKQIVIDFETGVAGIRHSDGFIVDPADFIAHELMRPWIETRPTPSGNSRLTTGF